MIETKDTVPSPVDLRTLIETAAGLMSYGLTPIMQTGLNTVLGKALRALAPQCPDEAVALHTAAALEAHHVISMKSAVPSYSRRDVPRTQATQAVKSSFDLPAVTRMLDALSPGQHLYVPVTEEVQGLGGHGLAIAVTRHTEGSYRLSVINSEGWPSLGRAKGCDMPAVFKTLSRQEMLDAMARLLSGAALVQPPGAAAGTWYGRKGLPLLTWLQKAGNTDAEPCARYHGGMDFRQRPQKGFDCGIEVSFAFMATVLPPAVYKLAKAAGLNALKEIYQALKESGDVPDDMRTYMAEQRLNERITNALSGSVAAPLRISS